MKFTGCACPQNCSGSTCICRQLNRECDPDICHTCGAVDSANPFNKHLPLSSRSCQNCSIQRGLLKTAVVGESQFGLGCFLVEPARRGDYLFEYVGEIVSDDEAERRGLVYDLRNTSFLFGLNKFVTIDAEKMGNVSR